jgi:glycosyltransferase involved in cell wall biosynthesis
MPSVSVIIPVYNRVELICQALSSVRAQTFRDFEVVVVDDGSTDSTAAVVKAHYPEVRLIQKENAGVSAARNRGIQEARGEWIAFLDSDDVWLPHKLSRQVAFLELHPDIDLLYARMWSYTVGREHERQLEPKSVSLTFEDLLNGHNSVTTSTVMVRRRVFDVVGMFNEGLPAVEDHELWIRIAERFKLGFLDEVVAEYRRHALSTTAEPVRLHEGYRRFYVWLIETYGDRLESRREKEKLLARFEYLCGASALKRGNRARARKLVGQALRRDSFVGLQFPRGSVIRKAWSLIKPYFVYAMALQSKQ